MNAEVYDAVPAPDDWWDPIRSTLMFSLDIPDEPIAPRRKSLAAVYEAVGPLHPTLTDQPPSSAVLTYVNRQGTGRRHLNESSHDSLMDALYEIEGEGLARMSPLLLSRLANCLDQLTDLSLDQRLSPSEVYDAKMEKLPKSEQLGLSSRTDILIGVHGNGLSHLMWMPRGSHIIEIFAKDGFTRDYEMLTRSLGHHYYAVWVDEVYFESEWRRAGPHFDSAKTSGIDFQGTEIE